MSFWRKEVIEPALDRETRKHMDEQLAWIAREPSQRAPVSTTWRSSTAWRAARMKRWALMLHAVQLDPDFAAAHAALAELYAVRARLSGGMAARAFGGTGRRTARGGVALAAQRAGIIRVRLHNSLHKMARLGDRRIAPHSRQISMRTFVTNTHLHPELDYHAFCQCADENSGNFYDFIPLPGSRLAISFGDLPSGGDRSLYQHPLRRKPWSAVSPPEAARTSRGWRGNSMPRFIW